MCGIFGILSEKIVDKEKLLKVSNVLSHRGPDDEGYLFFQKGERDFAKASGLASMKEFQAQNILNVTSSFNSVFLHRRLSIIDLSLTGHQPMSYDNESLWITFNGEIYNYLELKDELIRKGYAFKSSSDTEVILASYREWGLDCFQRFNGMWALAMWDSRTQTLIMSRDRFGVKPLYYYFRDGSLIFCSEIKGIRTYLDNNLPLNPRAVRRFLEIGEFPVGESENTMFSDVKLLSPGTNIILKDNNIQYLRYWNLEIRESLNSIEDNIDRVKELFSKSLELRLRSDVEVGSCLSGGIDSSSIVSCISSKFNTKLNTFSIIWPGEKCDESQYVEKVNKKYNCNAHAFTPDLDNILEVIDKVIWHQELPLATGSLLAQWFVMEKASKEGIKVLLDGQGADEIAAGYPRFIQSYINEAILNFQFKSLFYNTDLLKQYGYSGRSYLNIPKIFLFNILSSAPKRSFETNLNRTLKKELEVTCLPSLLHYEDRNSMAHSVESRVPFLDFRLVEFLFSIPSNQKIKNSRTKYILIEAMKDYLPSDIYNRRDKIGFETPIEKKLHSNGSYANYDLANDKKLKDYLGQKKSSYKESQRKFKYYCLSRFLDIYS